MKIDPYEIARPLVGCRLRLVVGCEPSCELVSYLIEVARVLENSSGATPVDSMDWAFAHVHDLRAGFHDGTTANETSLRLIAQMSH